VERIGPLPGPGDGGDDAELDPADGPTGPLVGVDVLDIGMWRPAPFAAQLLAELGATVTRIEPPAGDPMRAFPDLYRTLNGRKRIVTCDLKTVEGKAAALELATGVDAVLEGFRPGVADRLGIGPDAVAAVNPTAIYCSISGFGQTGSLVDAPGHDLNYQAITGVLAARAPEIRRSGVPIGDLAGGVYAALAICAALVGRARTGHGDRIDVSMTDVLLSWAGAEPGGDLVTDDDPGARFPGYGTFRCADGDLTLGVVTEDHFWSALCQLLGLDDLAGLDVAARGADGPALSARVAAALADRRRDDLVAQLIAAGVPAAPVLSATDAARLDHFIERGTSAPTPDGGYAITHPVHFARYRLRR
jgi:crotonobetainyl-CoA:carnitine CoA-transferase CaiB-like acyl-CoA transferase